MEVKEIAGAGYFYDLASHQQSSDYILGPIEDAADLPQCCRIIWVEDSVSGAFRFESGVVGRKLGFVASKMLMWMQSIL